MMKDAEAKCREMLSGAEAKAAESKLDELVAQEKERLECAKQTALNFIDVVEHDIRGHLELLESLKTRDLTLEKKETPTKKAYDYETETAKENTREIASQIQANLNKMGLTDDEELPEVSEEPKKTSDSPTIKFPELPLQFGRNYDPKANK